MQLKPESGLPVQFRVPFSGASRTLQTKYQCTNDKTRQLVYLLFFDRTQEREQHLLKNKFNAHNNTFDNDMKFIHCYLIIF